MLREVRYRIDTPGFRTRQITLVTMLLDAEAYRVSDLAELVPLVLAGRSLPDATGKNAPVSPQMYSLDDQQPEGLPQKGARRKYLLAPQ
jgi:hypothetical protein